MSRRADCVKRVSFTLILLIGSPGYHLPMHRTHLPIFMLLAAAAPAFAQDTTRAPAPDPIAQLLTRLDLERYKATIKGLTQFGDRRQGTTRNRAAVDWIESQLKSYGCAPERITYTYTPRGRGTDPAAQRGQAGGRGQADPAGQRGQG